MEFMLQLYFDEKRWFTLTEDESRRQMGAYTAYSTALHEAGAFVSGDPLQPTTTAATVSVTADGKTSVLDGPYADTKEQLGGYYIINVADAEAAIAWAARCPCASHGSVEVRPIMAIPAAV